MELVDKEYVVIVQCDIVKQRCPGYLCEKAFRERTGGFADYPTDKDFRVINITCGGCCGRALHRKLSLLKRSLRDKEQIDKDKIIVQFSSCIVKDNFHAPPCPHVDYLKALVDKLGIDHLDGTKISKTAERLRKVGKYQS